ncbi:hypothetical protein VTP01DRAFT_5233 [Rhizomucor pusillus]|uniref:uncharacterized protein n=1 Tax=Rhizomucor pusillus TaxID=4840 RepID=UPI003742075A
MEPDGEIQPVDQPDTVTQVPAESSAATIVEDDAGALQDQIAQHSETQYAFFQHDFTSSPAQLLATTGSKYNTSIVQTLEDEKDILQQRIQQFNIHDGNNHFRNVKWSPDGTYLLSNSNDNVLRLFSLPYEAYEQEKGPIVESQALSCQFGVREGEAVYDFAWFPSMNSQDPASCCFVASVRDHPVHLWDACTGKLRASYSVIDHHERFVGPTVVTFNLDGSRIYCGYENMIEIFDIQRPGQESIKIPTLPTRKSKNGQKGIISCLDFSPDYSGIYAAGSFSQSIGIYEEASNQLCFKLTGIQGGVTQVRFSLDGSLLFSASRVANTISCWDIRSTGNVLYELPRPGRTNQRIHFDLDPSGRVLVTGDQNGQLLFYDVATGYEDSENSSRLLHSFQAHNDLSCAATFNPVYPWLLASASGQRKYFVADGQDSDDTDRSVEQEQIDNSLKIWHLQGQTQYYTLDAP